MGAAHNGRLVIGLPYFPGHLGAFAQVGTTAPDLGRGRRLRGTAAGTGMPADGAFITRAWDSYGFAAAAAAGRPPRPRGALLSGQKQVSRRNRGADQPR